MSETQILFELFIMFAAAKIAGEIFERLKQPPVIGELIIGMIIGAHALGLLAAESPVQEAVSTIGVVVLLFAVGLETKVSELARVGRTATLVGISGIVLPFALGYLYFILINYNQIESLFIGTALVATSVGITARVLADMGLLQKNYSMVILGAAVVDDILAMMILAIVGGLARDTLSILSLILVIIEALAFVGFLVFIMPDLVKKHASILGYLHISYAPFIVALTICLGLSALAGYIGLAAIIGSFLAGMVFAETADRFELQEKTKPLTEFLVPFFFVVMGNRLEIESFFNLNILKVSLIVTLLAILGKIIGCSLSSYKMGFISSLAIGIGMIPRGEVGLIVAALGLKLSVIDKNIYSIVIIMVVLTTLIAPALLKMILSKRVEPNQI